MKKCHGCNGVGWVDSKFSGRGICPICKGTGEIDDIVKLTVEPATVSKQMQGNNVNGLLGRLEGWLQQQTGISFGKQGKAMNSYYSESSRKGKPIGLVFVTTRGDNRIYLRAGDYSSIDVQNRVFVPAAHNKRGFGGYPQFSVKNSGDLEYAKTLIGYAKGNL